MRVVVTRMHQGSLSISEHTLAELLQLIELVSPLPRATMGVSAPANSASLGLSAVSVASVAAATGTDLASGSKSNLDSSAFMLLTSPAAPASALAATEATAAAAQESCLFWADIEDCDQHSLSCLAMRLHLHALSVQQCRDTEGRERSVDISGSTYRHVVLCEWSYTLGSNLLVRRAVNMLPLERMLFTFHHGATLCTRAAMNYIESVGRIESSAWLVWLLCDKIIELFFGLVNQVVAEVDALEELAPMIAVNDQSDLLRRIGLARRRLAELAGTLWSKQEQLVSISRWAPPPLLVNLRDAHDHAHALLERIALCRDSLNHVDNSFLARISLELAERGDRSTWATKLFNTISSVMLAMGIFNQLFSMNVPLPGDDKATDNYFYGVLVCMLAGTLLFFFLLRKIHWL